MTTPNNMPIIGITTYGRDKSGNYYLPAEYVEAVRKAGGVPVLLPPGKSRPEQFLEFVDGLIFAGGGDIDPARYHEASHPSISRVDRERDAFELALAQKVVGEDTPVLGICRGSQLLNVATGGDLIVHVPDEFGHDIDHRTKNGKETVHLVQIVPNCRLAKIVDDTELSVVSQHHQAPRKIPSDWRVVGRAPDGVVEAMEHQKHPWMIAVLWHPELSVNDPHHLRLFQALIEAARDRHHIRPPNASENIKK
ncbi:MAG: gamma-glutamyl-gamma-aminobutyrate hydrolase family protein [bacterium]